MEEGDKETSDNVFVLEEVEWDQRVRGVLFFVYSKTDHETCPKYQQDNTVGYPLDLTLNLDKGLTI
jgi:hypothetical protein